MSLALGTTVVAIPDGQDHATRTLKMVTRDLDQTACSLTQSVTPDKPEVDPFVRRLPLRSSQSVTMEDGHHLFRLTCPSSEGPLTAKAAAWAVDGGPERCRGFAYPDNPISISTFAELEAGMVGTWEGCVTTPWTPDYWVTFTFDADGTYTSVSDEVLDNQHMVTLYYGGDGDSPHNRWALNDLQASGKGLGQIEIGEFGGSGARLSMVNIELMGDQLRFEVFNDPYGPITLQLYRAGTGR